MTRAATLVAVLGVFIAMTAIVLFRALGGDTPAEDGWSGRSTPVAAHIVHTREFADIVEALGTARANETVTITARVSDTISRINFDSGQRVEAGTILVELTDTEETASLSEARATLREARQELARVQDLIDRGIAPRQRLDEANAAVDRARARVTSTEAQLADRIIRAPFTGVIGLREVSVGSLVRPGDPIVTLDDTSLIKLDFPVPERFLSALNSGLTVEARTSAYPNTVFVGTISQIDSRIDPVTRTVTVRAEIENTDGLLRPGQLMTVEVRRNTRNHPAVPGAALTRLRDDTFVFVIQNVNQNSNAEQRSVELGIRDGDLVEVLSGLEVGEQVVAEGVHRVRHGMPVSVVETHGASEIGVPANSLTGQP